jgi:ubiquitin C-terminal hydrolase
MEMTFRLSDELVQKLQQLPNPDTFVGEVLKNALKEFSARLEAPTSQPSKWVKLMQRIDAQPGGLKGYSAQLQRDMQEFRENVGFGREAGHEVSP